MRVPVNADEAPTLALFPRPMSMFELEARIAALPCWNGKVALERLHGGLSNVSFVVHDGIERYVARCGSDVLVHHVFRERERAASIAAHAAGLSPELVHAESGIMILRYIEGRTFGEADLRVNIARIVPLVKACHREVARHLAGPGSRDPAATRTARRSRSCGSMEVRRGRWRR